MMKNDIRLGVNIDHIATLRQARGTRYPDPIYAASIAEASGADGITVHLREDRRHIQERDIEILNKTLNTRMNLEMAATKEMVAIASVIKPQAVCLVPEKREELTTEGGLDVIANEQHIYRTVQRLKQHDIEVSLFIDPEPMQIDAAKRCGADVIELHTGAYAEESVFARQEEELAKLTAAVDFASTLELIVNAGHGLHYHNVKPIAAIPQINELNIGHAIIAESVFCGLGEAVRRMKELMLLSR
jgi:pyridoxine 5-phosphate synthase